MPATFEGRTWTVTGPVGGLPTPIAPGHIAIESIYWENPINVGDQAIIQNSDGSIITKFIVPTNGGGVSQVRKLQQWHHGFQVTQLDSGTLYIELR